MQGKHMGIFSQFLTEKSYSTLARRFTIEHPKTLIYGPPKSGKTSLAIDFAVNSNFPSKKIIYFDLNDLRFSYEEAKSELLKLYLEKRIELLIIDGYSPTFSLPHLDHIILISQHNISLPSFHSFSCSNLTFVEYISFCSKNISIDSLLKAFIRDGNLPQMPFLNEHQKIKTKQESIKLAIPEDLDLFIYLASFQSQKITIFQFFTMLKKRIRISKDKIYTFFESLEQQGLIFFVPHIKPNKPKKLYFADFSLPKALLWNHTILPILENMFILELLSIDQEVYYDDSGCFVTPNLGHFLLIPFAQSEVIDYRFSKIPQKNLIKENLTIITLDFSSANTTHGITWKAITFAEFALGGME